MTAEVTRILSSMTTGELREVQAQVTFLLNGATKTAREDYLTEDEALFYNELIKVLRQNHVPHILSHEGTSLKPRLKGFKLDEFRERYEGVQSFLAIYAPHLEGVLRIRFYSILADALSCYIIGHGDTIGIRSMLTYLDSVEEVFEYEFPGYLRHNLFIRILEAYKR